MFEGFADVSTSVDGIEIHAIRGGRGPALLLLHGHPQPGKRCRAATTSRKRRPGRYLRMRCHFFLADSSARFFQV